MNEQNRNTTVLVTGGSGYVAGWLTVGLLREGYKVRATLRSLHREKDVRSAVAGLLDAEDRLSYVKADLGNDEGWSNAVSGCKYVLHAASPMGQGEPRGTDLVTPAREGTLRVLRAAAASGVSRVVYTSSLIAAQARSVPGEMQPKTDEATWTDSQEKGLSGYGRSKTLAERAAWDFIKRDSSGMTLSSILPGMILGPVMTQKISGSVEMVSRLLTGKVPAIPRIGFSITDVRDLVDLHLKVMTHPDAADQRFVGVGDFLWFSDIADILRKHFTTRDITNRRMPDWVINIAALFQEEARFMAPMLGKRREFDAIKAATLMDWTPRLSSAAVVDCGESLFLQELV